GRAGKDDDCEWHPSEPHLLHRRTDRHEHRLNEQGAVGHHADREGDLHAAGESGTLPQQRQPEWPEDEEQKEHDRPGPVVPPRRGESARNQPCAGIVPGAAKRREHGLPDGFWGQIETPPMAGSGGHHDHRRPRFASPVTETTPLAPSTAAAAAATERLAAWVIGALTAIVIGGVALVIYGPHGGHAGGSSWLPEINASLNATATILLS